MRKTPLKRDLARNKNCSEFLRDIFNGCFFGASIGKMCFTLLHENEIVFAL